MKIGASPAAAARFFLRHFSPLTVISYVFLRPRAARPLTPGGALSAKHRGLFLAIAMAATLAGCEAPQSYGRDQCLRVVLFQQCMSMLPKGPTETHKESWGEVVSQCESAAQFQSLRPSFAIKPECKV